MKSSCRNGRRHYQKELLDLDESFMPSQTNTLLRICCSSLTVSDKTLMTLVAPSYLVSVKLTSCTQHIMPYIRGVSSLVSSLLWRSHSNTGEGLRSIFPTFMNGTRIRNVEYCAHFGLQRQVTMIGNCSSTAGKFSVVSHHGYSLINEG